jgi:hypothetical protein
VESHESLAAVRVHIERVEIRAVQPAAPTPIERLENPAPRASTAPDLESYLNGAVTS